MRHAFQQQLDELEGILRDEAQLVVAAVGHAVDALSTGSVAIAEETIAGDDAVDERHHALERGIELLLARQTPVASDLRLVLALSHVNRNLERMGDQCVTIAKLAAVTADLPADEQTREMLRRMGERARLMTSAALDCLCKRDSERAGSVHEQDDLIDTLNRAVLERAIATGGGDEASRAWAVHMVLAARAFERIGDNAVDIAEQAGYLVTGQLVELTDASRAG